MRWLALWLLLLLTQIAGWAVIRLALVEPLPLDITRETLVHFALLPPAQVLAIALLRLYRKPRGPGPA